MAEDPGQEALDAIDVELCCEPRLQKAHPVNGIPASCRRVKLYEIYSTNVSWPLRRNIPPQDTWVDKGTGYCHIKEPADEGSPQIVIELEQEGLTVVVVSNILYNTNYSSQNDSIIIWQEGGEDRLYRALSFQNVVGHKSFWTYISGLVDEHCIQSSPGDRDGGSGSEAEQDGDVETASVNGSLPPDSGSPMGGGKYGGGYRALPVPTVAEMRKLETTLDAMLTQNSVSDMVFMDLLDRRWLRETFAVMRHCVEVEDLSTLSAIAAVMARLILHWCGNLELMHVFVSDELFFDLLQAFEYDAELLSQNLCLEHVKFFREHVKHHDVIMLGNASFYRLVHSSYRIEYLKDVVLPRQLDEFSIQRLNSVLFSNTNEILNIIASDGHGFVDALKNQLSKKYMAALMLRELLGAARCSQGVNQPDRISLLLKIKHSQLLNELAGYLDGTAEACADFEENLRPKNETSERNYSTLKDALARAQDYRPDLLGTRRHGLMEPVALAVEIFNLCLEVFPSIVRTAVYADAEAKNEPALLFALCDVIAANPDEGVQAQTRDIFLRLLDPKNMDLPEKDEMCSLFYDNGVLDRLIDLVFGNDVQDSPTTRTAKVHAMELLSLCAREHRHRFKLRVQSHKLPLRVLASSLRPFDKFVAVGAMKFLHVCIKMKDMSVERHITKYEVLRTVLWILKTKVSAGRDGGTMLESVCLGILSTIESWALDGLVEWLFQDPFCTALFEELKRAYAHCGDNFVFNNLERMYSYSRAGDPTHKKRHVLVDPDRWFEEDEEEELEVVSRRRVSLPRSIVHGYDDEDDYDREVGGPSDAAPTAAESDGWGREEPERGALDKKDLFEFSIKVTKARKINVFLDSCRKQPAATDKLIGFGRPAPRAPVAAGLGNAAFLPEEQVAAAFARLSGLSATEAVEVLRGERRVEEVPALDYCPAKRVSQRVRCVVSAAQHPPGGTGREPRGGPAAAEGRGGGGRGVQRRADGEPVHHQGEQEAQPAAGSRLGGGLPGAHAGPAARRAPGGGPAVRRGRGEHAAGGGAGAAGAARRGLDRHAHGQAPDGAAAQAQEGLEEQSVPPLLPEDPVAEADRGGVEVRLLVFEHLVVADALRPGFLEDVGTNGLLAHGVDVDAAHAQRAQGVECDEQRVGGEEHARAGVRAAVFADDHEHAVEADDAGAHEGVLVAVDQGSI
ncbi:component of IIS longevity pathway protein SMK-1 [Babesia caballi]|uniref:Component of IIS longevity pathway protein SMK-1 n=1 Tax=Babesia caballi TaxID=5871 RepID=A0AAV4LQH8_BABCB|nr:component of IIS longevity pathway protein SMK-1 [Babesia caballi]